MIRQPRTTKFFLRNRRSDSQYAVKIFRFKPGKAFGLSLMGDSKGARTHGMTWTQAKVRELGTSEITKSRAEELMPGVSTAFLNRG